MLQGEHSAILLTFIKLPFVIKIFVLSIFEWPFTQVLLCKEFELQHDNAKEMTGEYSDDSGQSKNLPSLITVFGVHS